LFIPKKREEKWDFVLFRYQRTKNPASDKPTAESKYNQMTVKISFKDGRIETINFYCLYTCFAYLKCTASQDYIDSIRIEFF